MEAATTTDLVESTTLPAVRIEALAWRTLATDLTIATPDDYAEAVEHGREVSRLIAAVKEAYAAPKSDARGAWQAIVDEEHGTLAPLELAKATLSTKTAAFRKLEEERRQEADRVARMEAARQEAAIAEQRRKEAEALEAEAQRLREEADRQAAALAPTAPAEVVAAVTENAEHKAAELERAAEAVREAPPVHVPPPTAPTTIPRSSTARGRETWSAELDPDAGGLRAVVAAIHAGTLPLEWVDVNWKVAHANARAMKSTFSVPGLRAVSKSGTSFGK